MATFRNIEKEFKRLVEAQGVDIVKMKPKAKRRWIENLISGEYKQTTGTLHRPKMHKDMPVGYCCLGVLAHCYRRTKAFLQDIGNVDYLDIRGELGSPLLQYTGLNSDVADIFAQLNDHSGANFKQIAKLIDKYL